MEVTKKMNALPGIVSINQSLVALPDLTAEGYTNMCVLTDKSE